MPEIAPVFKNARQNRISIIGAGNTGCALAADLKHRGYEVCLYAHPEHAGRLNGIKSRGKMNYSGIIEGECTLDLLTCDEAEALTFASDIILALPSYAQEEMFERLARHIGDHHKIINLNGNFSSYMLAKMAEGRSPVIVETNCAPHVSRAASNGDVEILGAKKFLPIASVGVRLNSTTKADIDAIIPGSLEWHPDIVAVSMQAYNGVLHPAPMVLNAGRIEPGLRAFRFYAEGISESVGKIIEQIDKERLTIARLYGHNHLRTTLEALQGIYDEKDLDTMTAFAKNAKVYQGIDCPSDIKNRYLLEDVPFILVPWYQLGQRMGYEAKAIRSIIDLSSIMHGTEYLKTGRTLDKMVLPSLDSQLKAWLPAAESIEPQFA